MYDMIRYMIYMIWYDNDTILYWYYMIIYVWYDKIYDIYDII